MKFLNLNALQTVLSAILAALPVLLINLGCTDPTGTGRLDCSQASFSPWLLMYIAGGISLLKFFVLPAIQPGGWFRNLFEPKVPVSPTGAVGTVTQGQVDASPSVKKAA